MPFNMMSIKEKAMVKRQLAVGDVMSNAVPAEELWHDTGIEVKEGEEYRFAAVGRWTDWCIPCDANGYASTTPMLKASESLRRMPQENWFALIGAVGRNNGHYFRIGAKSVQRMPAAGTLYCFANDVPWMYWNNQGTIQLTITRIQ